mgnify:CR=1 FL=1
MLSSLFLIAFSIAKDKIPSGNPSMFIILQNLFTFSEQIVLFPEKSSKFLKSNLNRVLKRI